MKREVDGEPLLPFDQPDAEVEKETGEPTGILKFDIEKDDCQYCQDVGPCRYCDRGRREAELVKRR